MIKRQFDRTALRATAPKVARLVLCDNHGYLTYAGECSCSVQHDFERFLVVGTTYGVLHNTAGDMRLFKSESAARRALKSYVGV
jgi:hypothetical protein